MTDRITILPGQRLRARGAGSNASGRFEQHGATWREAILQQFGRAPTMETMRVIMGVSPEFLERSLTVIEQRNGGVEGYLRDELQQFLQGIDPPERVHAFYPYVRLATDTVARPRPIARPASSLSQRPSLAVGLLAGISQ